MGLTTDPEDPELKKVKADGQHAVYLVLSDEERAKGFVRPVRTSYKHLACGTVTTVGLIISETYARDPKFYGATFCVGCGRHFYLEDANGIPNFLWEPDGEPVGSDSEEATTWNAKEQEREAEKNKGSGI